MMTGCRSGRAEGVARSAWPILAGGSDYLDCPVPPSPPERLRKLVPGSRRFLPDHPTPVEITADEVIEQLRRAGARRWANLLFPLRPGEAHELHRFNAELAE